MGAVCEGEKLLSLLKEGKILSNVELQGAIGLKPETNKRWLMVFMVATAIAINYLDRVNFSVATPTLMETFGLTAAQMGVLMSAFFWSYTLMMLPAGGLLNRFGPKPVMFGSAFGWGVMTMLTGACNSFATFFAVRIGLGLTEAPGFPASARVVSVWVPVKERTFASACFDCCARLGSAFAPPIVAWLIINYGWKASFVITGAIAVVFSFIWLMVYKEPDEHPTVSESELAYIRQDEVLMEDGKVQSKPIPMLKLFLYPVVAKVSIGYAMYLYVWTVFNTWMPAYLVQERGLSLAEMGFAAMYPYICAVICELIGGKVFDTWYARGATVTQLRRTGMTVGLIGSALFIFLCMQAETATLAVVCLCAFMGIFAFGASNVWAIPSDIAPYGQAGGVGGIYNFVGNFGSLLAPMVTGFFVGSKYGYNGAFIVCVVVAIIAAGLFFFNKYDRLEPKASDLVA